MTESTVHGALLHARRGHVAVQAARVVTLEQDLLLRELLVLGTPRPLRVVGRGDP